MYCQLRTSNSFLISSVCRSTRTFLTTHAFRQQDHNYNYVKNHEGKSALSATHGKFLVCLNSLKKNRKGKLSAFCFSTPTSLLLHHSCIKCEKSQLKRGGGTFLDISYLDPSLWRIRRVLWLGGRTGLFILVFSSFWLLCLNCCVLQEVLAA